VRRLYAEASALSAGSIRSNTSCDAMKGDSPRATNRTPDRGPLLTLADAQPSHFGI